MKTNVGKLFIFPLLLASTLLVGCKADIMYGESVTYRDVILKDLVTEEKLEYKNMVADRPLTVDRSFICVDGAICFIPDPVCGTFLGSKDYYHYVYELEEDCVLSFRVPLIPLIWKDHVFYEFPEAYKEKIYSKEDMLKIQSMYDNGENDYSFLDLPYVEKDSQ